MEEAARLNKLEEGKKLFLEKRKKKTGAKKKKKKALDVSSAGTDTEASMLDESSIAILDNTQDQSHQDEVPAQDDSVVPNQQQREFKLGLEEGVDGHGNSQPQYQEKLQQKDGVVPNSLHKAGRGLFGKGELENFNFDDGIDPVEDTVKFFDNWDHMSLEPDDNPSQPSHTNPGGGKGSNKEPSPLLPPTGHFNSTSSSDYTHGNAELEWRLAESQDIVMQLQNESVALKEEREQILNELNALRESQFDAIERTRREVSSNYAHQVTGVQQRAVECERQLHAMEQQLLEVTQSRSDERERHAQELSERNEAHLQELSERDEKHALALGRHEQMHAEMLSERDRRHTEQLAQVSATASATLPSAVAAVAASTTNGLQHDADEQEAERLRMIKEKMRELHAKEKLEMTAEHSREKEQLQATFQRQFDDYRTQVQATANTQIKDMYDKFVSAHKTAEEQNESLKSTVERMGKEVSELSSRASQSQQEKAALEERYRSVLESHSAEIQMERSNSIQLEHKLNDWCQKAARLEAELAKSEVAGQGGEEGVDAVTEEGGSLEEEEREAMLSQIRGEFESKIDSLEARAEEYQGRLREAEDRHRHELLSNRARAGEELEAKLEQASERHGWEMEELKARFEEQLSELKAAHSSQVDLLETSISELAPEKGSLEAAEEHMSSLREQLNTYRNQEMNFEARLADLSRQHEEDLGVLRKQLEAEKSADVEQMRGELLYRIDDLEKVVSAHTSEKDGAIERLRRCHQQELEDSVAVERARSEAALLGVRSDLDAEHGREVERLTRQVAEEREALASSSAAKLAETRESTRKQVWAEAEDQLRTLRAESAKEVARLREALSGAEKEFVAKSEDRIKKLEGQLAELGSERATWEASRRDMLSQMELKERRLQELQHILERVEAERNQVSEDRDRFQKRLKKLEVDASIAKSAEERDRRSAGEIRTALEQCQGVLQDREREVEAASEEVERMAGELESLRKERKTGEAELLEQLEAKGRLVVELQVENDALKSNVDSLCRKQQEYIDVCETLERQLKESQGLNEKLVTLQEQVIELAACKEGFEGAKVEVRRLEEAVRNKDDAMASLRDDLEQRSRALEEGAQRGARLEEALEVSRKEAEHLKGCLSGMAMERASVEGMFGDKAEEERLKFSAELERVRRDLKQAESLRDEHASAMERSKLVVKELQAQLADVDTRRVAEIAERDRCVEELRAKLVNIDAKHAAEIAEKAQTAEELRSKLAEVDAKCVVETAGRDQTVEELRRNLAHVDAKHEAEIAERDRNVEELRSKLAAAHQAKELDSLEVSKMERIVQGLQSQLASVGAESADKSEAIHKLSQAVEDLEGKLAEAADLREEKSQLELDLLRFQAGPDSSGVDADLAEKHGVLQQEYQKLREENNKLIAEVNDIRSSLDSSSTPVAVDALKAKIEEQADVIAKLREELHVARSKASGPHPFFPDDSRSPLEATLSRARQSLTEKLQQKSAIEKELSLRRANLERQKAEKQYLEDLLFEKKRFEQELQNQKNQLVGELDLLEGKLSRSKNSSGSSSFGGGGGGVGRRGGSGLASKSVGN